MTALTKDVQRSHKPHDYDLIEVPVNAGSAIFTGALVCREAATGMAIPGADTAGLVFLGLAHEGYDNTDGADGTVVHGLSGNERTALIDRAGKYLFATDDSPKVGEKAYIVDDNKVGLAATTTNDIACGTFVEPGPSGYWFVDISKDAV